VILSSGMVVDLTHVRLGRGLMQCRDCDLLTIRCGCVLDRGLIDGGRRAMKGEDEF
jgi:hypothetical protein